MSVDPTGSLAPEASAARALFHLMRAGESYRRAYAKRLGLGRTDFIALWYLYGQGPAPSRDLGAVLGMSSGTMTTVLDRLEKRGYTARSEHPKDRRSLLVVLSPHGQSAMDGFRSEFEAVLKDAVLEFADGGRVLSDLAEVLPRLSDAVVARLDPGAEDLPA